MAKKIDFKKTVNDEKPIIKEGEKVVEDSDIIKSIMDKKYPDKMLFDIKTVSEELSCSYEFIRIRIADGIIKCVKLGVNKMIPRSEFIKLLTEGV
jgi:hypothetical protein